MIEIHNKDCLEYLKTTRREWTCIFADPPDNIGLKYNEYEDHMNHADYVTDLEAWLYAFVKKAQITWLSFNAKWWAEVGGICRQLSAETGGGLKHRLMIQTFTFGQHRHTDLGNNFRPLVRLMWKDAKLYPDAIRVESVRQKMGDKRADPRGRVPGDVFDFPRVVGNSKQRRAWHPTQLAEGLVERCIRLSTTDGDTVLDPFAGTGTTGRVCQRLERDCTLLDIDEEYCLKMAQELHCNEG